MKQIYIEWRDAVGKSRHTSPDGDKPSSCVLRGTSWLVDEDDTDLIVAAYIADDGGFMDMVAIPKSAIEKREDVVSTPSGLTPIKVILTDKLL